MRCEGIAISKLGFICRLCMTPAVHWVGVQEHMNNRKHMKAVLNSSEEEYTDEEQAAFTEKWKKVCDAHIEGLRTNTKPCDHIDTNGYYKKGSGGPPKMGRSSKTK